MTAQELINASGRLIGELRADRSFGANESAQLLILLNNLLAAWSEEQWAIPQKARELLTLTGAPSYTMGPTGDLNTTRPIIITAAETISAGSVRMPAKIVTDREWTDIADDAETGSFINMLFADYGYPLITLRPYPKPASGTLILYSLKPLTAFALLSTNIDLPMGYEIALRYGFAVAMAAEFSKQAPADVVSLADRYQKAIAATNAAVLNPPAPPMQEAA